MPDAADPALDDPRRAVALAGGRNFRDLGGYATQDGRRVRWGRIYRSGSLAGVTGEGVETLRALGIRSLCDLRSSGERAHEPYHWAPSLSLTPWARDYETSFGDLRRVLATPLPDGEAAREAMLAGYRHLPFEQAPAYRALFARLVAGETPLVFNCSAGKDRAGTAAALILMALGAPRETIVADYALTDRLVDLEAVLARPATPGGMLGRQPPSVVRAILGCDPAYIAAAMDAAAPTDAAFAAYLRDELGVTPAMRDTMRDRLLEA